MLKGNVRGSRKADYRVGNFKATFMADKPMFNQENVNAKIAEIKSMPEPERREIANAIQEDLKHWLRHHFTLDEIYEHSLNLLDDSIAQEWGDGIALALINDNWELNVTFPPEPAQAKACEGTSQTVKGTYNPQTGSYTIEKSITWKY